MGRPNISVARFLAGFLLGISGALVSGGTARCQNPRNIHTFPDGSEAVFPFYCSDCLNDETIRVGEGCVAFFGGLGPPEFFNNNKFKRKNTAQGPVFQSNHKVVTDFPDRVTLWVNLISGAKCSKGGPPGPGPLFPPLDTLETLRAEAEVVRNSRREPLEIKLISKGYSVPPGSPGSPLTPGGRPNPMLDPHMWEHFWTYRFEIKTAGVRLTDSLVITLYSDEGRKVTQLSWRQ